MANRSSQARQHRRRENRRARRRLTIALFAVGTVAILGIAVFLVVRPLQAVRGPVAAGDDYRMTITMAGFAPPMLRVPAGRPFVVRFVNPDSPYHTDGGGWHQFRVERLGVDVRIPPRSERSQAFAGLAAGTYEFYCDVCCGGKDNPTMRGRIEVTG